MNFLSEFITIIPALKRHRIYENTSRIDNLIANIQNIISQCDDVIQDYSHQLEIAYKDTLDNKILPGLKSVARYQYDVIETISNGMIFNDVAYIKTIDDELNSTPEGTSILDTVIKLETCITTNTTRLQHIISLISQIKEIDANHNVLFSKVLDLYRDEKNRSYYEGLAQHNPSVYVTSGLFALDVSIPNDINLCNNIHRTLFEKTSYVQESLKLREELENALRGS